MSTNDFRTCVVAARDARVRRLALFVLLVAAPTLAACGGRAIAPACPPDEVAVGTACAPRSNDAGTDGASLPEASTAVDAVVTVDAASDALDSSLPDAAATDAAADGVGLPDAVVVADPCSAGTVFYAEIANNYGGLPNGPLTVTADAGAWNSIFQQYNYLDTATLFIPAWEFYLALAPGGTPFHLGTYQSTGSRSAVNAMVSVAGAGCPSGATGPVTISRLLVNPTNPTAMAEFEASFQLACSAGGTVSGCVSFQNQ